MWLIPKPIFRSSAVAPDSTSEYPSLFQDLAASVTSSGSLRLAKYWQRVWKTDQSTALQYLQTCEPSSANSIVAEWLESSVDFHARTCPSPVVKPESPESIAGCGLNISESFGRYNPDGSISKMSPHHSLFQQEELYSEGLPKAGSMRNGLLYERPTWEPHIGDHAHSSWPTATKGDAESGQTQANPNRQGGAEHESLRVATANWPTPRVEAERNSRESMTRDGHWSAPALGQVAELAMGELPREFRDESAVDSLTGAAGLWMTPQAPTGGRSVDAETVANKGSTPEGKRTVGLESQSKFWATPSARDWKSGEVSLETMERNARPLNEQAVHLTYPTPSASTATIQDMEQARFAGNGGKRPKYSDCSLPDPATAPDGQPSSESAPGSRRPSARKRLNVYFVEALMGIPAGWTSAVVPIDSARWETWLSHSRRLVRYLFSQEGQV
jgi:hypothetical protein